jgi:hypothetical protein
LKAREPKEGGEEQTKGQQGEARSALLLRDPGVDINYKNKEQTME